MSNLYTPEEFDDIPVEARVLEVVIKRAKGTEPVVFFVTSRAALDLVGEKYGSYEATVVRDGAAPWDSEKMGII